MECATSTVDFEDELIVLDRLHSVDQDGTRTIAGELGIALGLVNAYLTRGLKKGLVKALDAPACRYGYCLTPQGFAEKSAKARSAFAPGENVLAGAFLDRAGLFNEVAVRDRVSILLDMLGRQVRVLREADMVAAA